MKKVTYALIILATLVCFAGCAGQKTTTTVSGTAPTLPANARDATDANAFRVIADAYAFLNSISNSQITLTAAQKTVFNDVVVAYNTAYTLGLAYHAGASSDAAGLTAATNNLSTQLTSASTQIVVPQ